MPRLMYTRDYADEATLDRDVAHLRKVLSSKVTGSIYRKGILCVMLHSEDPIDFKALGSSDWVLESRKQSA